MGSIYSDRAGPLDELPEHHRARRTANPSRPRVETAGGRLGCPRLVADIPYRLARCSYQTTLPALP